MNHSKAIEDAGLSGWKVSFHKHPKITGHRVCVIASPDYCPVRNTGQIFAAVAGDDTVAFSHVLKTAREAVHGQIH